MSSATTGIPGEETSLVARLDLEQKVRLLTGRDSWVLYGVGADGPLRRTGRGARNPLRS